MGNIHQTRVGNLPRGKVGALYGDTAHYRETSYGVADGRAAQVTDIVVATATNSATYTLTIFGETVTYTADSSTSKSEISAGLLAAIEDNPVLTGLATYVDDTTDKVTATASYPGLDLVIETTDAKLTITEVTAEDEGDTIPFARAVKRDSSDPTRCVAYSATTKSVDLALTYDASVDAFVGVTVNGIEYTATHTQATDADTSTAALVTQLNAILPANTVAATNDTGVITLTGEVVGQDFTVSAGFGPGRDTGAWAITVTAEDAEVLGVTRATYNEAAVTIGDSTSVGYPPGRDAIVLERGRIFVEGGSDATPASPVYIGTTASEKGKFFTSSGSGRVLDDSGNLKWHSANVIEITKGL